MKRIFDFLIALMALVLLSPFLIVISILIRFKLGSPVFFTQERPGLKGRVFTIYKFRSMLNAMDESGNILPDEARLPSFGIALRSTSIDELPALWNVLKGDLSLVGPRPLLVEYLPLYNEEQSRRHDVKPGITGWAQVNGRNAISWEEKFKLDVWYVENQNFWFDLKILYLTVKKVIFKEDISQEGHVTMSHFVGTKNGILDDLDTDQNESL